MYPFPAKSITPAYRVLDTAVAVASLVMVLVILNLRDDARELGPFLETRVTLKNVLLVTAMTLTWPAVFGAFGLYRFGELTSLRIELSRLAKACTLGSSFAVVVALMSVSGAFGMASVVLFLLVVTIGTACARAAGRRVLKGLGGVHPTDHIIIAGTGPKAMQYYREIAGRASQRVIGFVDTTPEAPPLGAAGPPFLGTIADLETILVSREVAAVHILLPVKSCYVAIAQVIGTCERVGVESCYEADIFPRARARPSLGEVGLVVEMKVVTYDYRLWIKRIIDITGALFALLVLSPVIVGAALAIRCSGPGPILFAQERFGFNRRRFRMYKFRSMVADAEARQADLESRNEAAGPIFKIRQDPRVTAVGRVLRKTSIDELPQLLNVLRGEMSLVGPRPMAVRDVSRFTEAALMRRFSVKPGMTCLWQINGRSNIGFDRWIELDLEYIDQWSLTLDLQILAKTVPVVVRGSGAI